MAVSIKREVGFGFSSPLIRVHALPLTLSICLWKSLSAKVHVMATTYIIECNQCGGLMLATAEKKTRSCPYCGARLDLQRTKRLASAQSAFEASEILRKIKGERQSNTRKLDRK